MKSLPVPVPFLAVAVMTVAVFIFFGAWAVSADVEERDRVFSFGFPIAGAELSAPTSDGYYAAATGSLGQHSADQTLADTWWGKTLLTACPLH